MDLQRQYDFMTNFTGSPNPMLFERADPWGSLRLRGGADKVPNRNGDELDTILGEEVRPVVPDMSGRGHQVLGTRDYPRFGRFTHIALQAGILLSPRRVWILPVHRVRLPAEHPSVPSEEARNFDVRQSPLKHVLGPYLSSGHLALKRF